MGIDGEILVPSLMPIFCSVRVIIYRINKELVAEFYISFLDRGLAERVISIGNYYIDKLLIFKINKR